MGLFGGHVAPIIEQELPKIPCHYNFVRMVVTYSKGICNARDSFPSPFKNDLGRDAIVIYCRCSHLGIRDQG